MSEPIFTAHQRRPTSAFDEFDAGRDVEERKANPPLIRGIGQGAVRSLLVMQRDLAGGERHFNGRRFVDAGQCLPFGQHVVLAIGFLVRERGATMAARQDPQTTMGGRRVAECHPCRYLTMGRKPEVGRVLVPGHETWIFRVLDEGRCAVEQDVGSDQIFDRIE